MFCLQSVMQWREWSEEGLLDLWTAERVYQALDEMSAILFGVNPQFSQELVQYLVLQYISVIFVGKDFFPSAICLTHASHTDLVSTLSLLQCCKILKPRQTRN